MLRHPIVVARLRVDEENILAVVHPLFTLGKPQVTRLWRAIRETLDEAIECGSTVPLDYAGTEGRDGLFYFGRAASAPDYYEERLRVYDRAGKPCPKCRSKIKRVIQGARSTFYCPRCQSGSLRIRKAD